MDNLQAQDLFEGIEVSVSVQQLMSGQQTEGGDPAINRLANRDAATAQSAVITGRRKRQVCTAGGEYPKSQQVFSGSFKGTLVPNALQNFGKDQIGESKTFPGKCLIEPIGFMI